MGKCDCAHLGKDFGEGFKSAVTGQVTTCEFVPVSIYLLPAGPKMWAAGIT